MTRTITQITNFADGRHHVAFELGDGTIITVALQAPVATGSPPDPADRAESAITSLACLFKDSGEELPTASDARERQDKDMLEEQLEAGLMDSFPASDPVSVSVPSVLPKNAARE